METAIKTCRVCKERKTWTEFAINRGKPTNLCKKCSWERYKKWVGKKKEAEEKINEAPEIIKSKYWGWGL